jgi:3-dehydroquinate synthase
MTQTNITLAVNLEPAYAITIGRQLTPSLPHKKVALLVDASIAALHAEPFKQCLEQGGAEVFLEPIPSGESAKTLQVHAQLLSKLSQLGLTRDSAVIALGGGATSDLAGYVAASYLRGIAFYVIPTTLLAMVDASVGGKTGVNLPEGKNLVGAFHQPKAVWMDLNTLETLPKRVFREGAAELFKHGLIQNPKLCDAVLEPGFGLHHPQFARVLADAVQVKINVVERDPTEQHERAFLNFGHTLAHALEAATHHDLPHGEAVGYGMHYATLLGQKLGYADLTARTQAFLEYQQPMQLPALDWRELRGYMARDKKADAGGVRFVMLEDIAKPKLERVPEDALEQTWRVFIEEIAGV